jgi:hypothetical protein
MTSFGSPQALNPPCSRADILFTLVSNLPEPFSEQLHLARHNSPVLDRPTMSSCGNTVCRQILSNLASTVVLLLLERLLTTSKKGRTSTMPGVFLQSLMRSMAIANIPSWPCLNNHMRLRECLTHQIYSRLLHSSIGVLCQVGREGSARIGICPNGIASFSQRQSKERST